MVSSTSLRDGAPSLARAGQQKVPVRRDSGELTAGWDGRTGFWPGPLRVAGRVSRRLVGAARTGRTREATTTRPVSETHTNMPPPHQARQNHS